MIECTDDGILSIDFTDLLGYPCQIEITPWQQGVHWTNTLEPSNATTCRFYQLGIPYWVLARETKTSPWINRIPPEIRPKLIEYESTYPGLIFPLLFHISRNREAYELFINQPRFTFIILSHCIRMNAKLEEVTGIFSLNLRNILKACDLPPFNSAVRFIRILRLRKFGPEQYVTIRRLLRSGHYRNYNYCEKIDDDWLYPLVKNPELVKIPIVRQMLISYRDFDFIKAHNITAARLGSMGVVDIDTCLTKCRIIDSLTDLLVKLADQTDKRHRRQLPDIKYGDPPIRGTEDIIPITTLKELALEGYSQENCVGSYHDRIISGEHFAYKVLKPERATLMLSKDANENFKINQLKIFNNGEPSNDTKAAISDWYKNFKFI